MTTKTQLKVSHNRLKLSVVFANGEAFARTINRSSRGLAVKFSSTEQTEKGCNALIKFISLQEICEGSFGEQLSELQRIADCFDNSEDFIAFLNKQTNYIKE